MFKPVTHSTQSGQGLVEFSLVVILLLVFVVAMFDLGRAFFGLITITNSSREGARYLTLHPRDSAATAKTCSGGVTCNTAFCCTLRAALQEATGTQIGLTTANVAVTYCRDMDTFTGCDTGFPVRVTVTYNFTPITGWVIRNPIVLRRSTEMLVP